MSALDVSKEIGHNNAILLILNPDDHSTLSRFIDKIKEKKLCIVSLSREYEVVQDELKKLGVELKNMFILDCVTSSFSREKPPEHVLFVPSPDALTDMNIAIIETMKNEKCDYLIFDSISTLLTYQKDALVARFIDFVLGKIKEFKGKTIFTCLEGDSKRQAIQEISLHVDKVIRASEFDGKEGEGDSK